MAILSHDELVELTGYKTPFHQRQALTKAGIKYVRRSDGRPSTTWEAVNSVLCKPVAAQGPKLDWIKQDQK